MSIEHANCLNPSEFMVCKLYVYDISTYEYHIAIASSFFKVFLDF